MTVTGKRSPRWAFWLRMVIPCDEHAYYLVRLRLIQTPWFGVYLHDIHEPDSGRDPHDHPWTFVSIVLRGGYLEHLWTHPIGDPLGVARLHHNRWSVHRMQRQHAHRIVLCDPGTKTLVLTGPRRGNWGFYTPHGWVAWDQYERH